MGLPLSLGISTSSFAKELPFTELWSKIEASSPTQKASEFELEAARTASARAGRHWYPYVYADAKGYTTNDPGLSLFSTLGQRQMLSTDFMPDKLNHPESNFYEKVSLGAALPLFEGGTRVAQSDAAKKMSTAKEFESKANHLKLYTETVKIYGNIITELQSRRALESLLEVLDHVIAHYKIGSKENPVGYSGLLGLKSVRNRVSGSIVENESKIVAYREALEKMSEGLPEKWTPVEMSTLEYATKYLNISLDSDLLKPSYRVEGFASMAEAAQDAIRVERAKFMPKVGLFVEGDLLSGKRDTATSYVGGAYLQWDLFLAPNFGAIHQAENTSAAAQAHVDEARLYEGIETKGNISASQALESNLKILDESSNLLDEQTKVAKKLFLSGAMNALQLAEVLNRRTDLISSLGTARTEYLKVKATLANNTNYKITNLKDKD